jgi:hypothetical protein
METMSKRLVRCRKTGIGVGTVFGSKLNPAECACRTFDDCRIEYELGLIKEEPTRGNAEQA